MQRILLVLLIALFLVAALVAGRGMQPETVYALSNPCAFDSNNLISNGMMREGSDSQWGPVAGGWTAFVQSGSPTFNWVDNEGIDPGGSQYIFGDAPYDAGIYQTVPHLQQGAYYRFWVGYALAAYDNGDSVNRRYDQIGRKVGVDVTGGTDPNSPNVTWGAEFTNGGPAINIPAMSMIFAAQSDHVTVFVRAINHSPQYRNKVWFDSICMEPKGDMPTATPLATSTPSPAPTNTPRVAAAAARAPVVPVATKAPTSTPLPTDTPTLVPTNTPTITKTPTRTPLPTETPRSRRPIPLANAAIDPGGSSSGGATQNSMGIVVLFGSFGLIGMSLLGIFGLGAFIVLRVMRRPSSREIPYY